MKLNGESLPLLRAAELGRVEIMTMLLDAGADINAVDKDHSYCMSCRNFLPVILMRSNCWLSVVQISTSSIPMATHCSRLLRYDKYERFVVLLLDAGAPLDGLSPFHVMRLVTSVAVFNRLLARGVNFTAMRDERFASLCYHVARNVTSEDDLRFLFNVCGNDAVHAVDNHGETPLHWASLDGNDLAVRVLVELGADIDRQDDRGRSALIDAAASAQSSCIELLLALGADVSLVDKMAKQRATSPRGADKPASLFAACCGGRRP
jgi:ankyrin repeat protein